MEEQHGRNHDGLVLGGLSGVALKAFYAVYNGMPRGLLESVYRAALVVEIQYLGYHCETEFPVTAAWRGVTVGQFRLDILVAKQLVIEVKVARAIHPIHKSQLLNYLVLSKQPVGLVLNFGPKAQFERVVGPAARGKR
ncbi:MAG: hypothetical protein JWO05_3907 [Gemmatimonadetes bacterium]|nr:hypothetical protein [Gemmatimonadota bacterium]